MRNSIRTWLAGWLTLAATCLLATPASAAEPAAWQKFKGKPEALAPEPAFATPGMYLNLPARTVAFPAGGLAIDLPLDGTLPGGKSIKASIQPNRALWIDVNGDGKTDTGERFNPNRTGYGPVSLPIQYKNGTAAPYSFHLVQTATAGTYELRTGQMVRYTVTWDRRKLTLILLDQNNNGRYDETGQDVVLVDSRPGSFLAKTITVGADAGAACEIVVYPDGTTLELREYAGPTGVLDPVSGYVPPQNGIQLAYLAVESALARPGFSAAFPRARVPVGNYEFASALLQRGRESVRVEKGGLPVMAVAADTAATPAWGGVVELKYGFRRDGDFLVFDSYKFVGKEHQELYLPHPPFTLNLSYRVEEIINNLNGNPWAPAPNSLTLAVGNLEQEATGAYKPLQVKHRGRKMLLMVNFSYPSGVLGMVTAKDKMEFTPQDAGK